MKMGLNFSTLISMFLFAAPAFAVSANIAIQCGEIQAPISGTAILPISSDCAVNKLTSFDYEVNCTVPVTLSFNGLNYTNANDCNYACNRLRPNTGNSEFSKPPPFASQGFNVAPAVYLTDQFGVNLDMTLNASADGKQITGGSFDVRIDSRETQSCFFLVQ